MSTRDAQQVDFDHHTPEFGSDQARKFAELRGRCPVAHTDAHGGFWVVSTYADAKRVLSDHETFTVEIDEHGKGGKLIPTAPDAPRVVPGILDGEPHDRLRDPLRRSFSRGPIEAKAAPIARRVAKELIGPLAARDSFDFATEFSVQMTIGTVFAFVGLTEIDDQVGFINMLEDAFAIDPEAGAAREALAASAAAQFARAQEQVGAIVAARRAAPRDDLLSIMVSAEAGLADEEVVSLSLSMVLGGVRTTAASLDNMLVHLDRDRALRRTLIEQPDQIPNAVNELIRLYTVTPLVARTALADVEVGDVTIHTGDRVAALLAAANLDEHQFPDPEQVKLDRRNGLHLAFGNGMHYCLGIWLAKMELRVALETVLEAMPDYSVVDEETTRYTLVGVNNGYSRVTVRPRP